MSGADLERWRALWKSLGAGEAGEPLFRDLIARYSEPHRRYHTVRHLDECLEKLDELRADAERSAEIELALWFHDAIYEVRRHDNEALSADWARSAALAAGVAAPAAGRIHALVMATRHDAVPRGADEKILVDVDLSILGAPVTRFDEYERQVREEYGWVPDVLFRRKRREILGELLKRPTIFNTDRFIGAYEARARENLERSLGRLQGKKK